MIIQKISEIKQAGVWKNFSAPRDLELAPRTLIYGFNGSGKTTLARIFSSIGRGELEERLPKGAQFKIQAMDGTTVSEELRSNPFGNNLLIFNSDFVSKNFEWQSGSTKGIAYLSETKVDARREFDALAPRLSNAQKKADEYLSAKTKAENDLKGFKTRAAKSIREVAASSAYTQAYDARKIQTHYSQRAFGADQQLTEDDLKKNQEILIQREPMPRLEFSAYLPDGLIDWFRRSKPLLTQSISDIALDEFATHSDALRWVEQGLHYHDEHGVANCLLCGNEFSKERRGRLRALFDDSWTRALRTLEDTKARGQDYQRLLREFYRSIPKEAEVAPEERGEFAKSRSAMESAVTRLGVCVRILLDGLSARTMNPTKEAAITGELADFDVDRWQSEYSAIEADVVAMVNRHNDAFARFEEAQKRAFERIEAHVLATNQGEWNGLQSTISTSAAAQLIVAQEVKELTDRQLALQNTLHDHGVGAGKLNDLIWSYLGHKELRLVAQHGGYGIVRPNRMPATEMSEGERSAISFCYFLTQLEAEGRKLKDLVLVIDDPISSLDTAARTHAFSLMTRMIEKCAQVIVLTHNTSFMNMVKRRFQELDQRRNNNGERKSALLFLDCRCSAKDSERSTTLVPMHGLLVKYNSEYHYLFSLVMDAAEKGETDYLYLLPNATRKLLEIFATFCSPRQSNFAAALGEHHQSVKDKLDVRALERLVQIKSHGTIDGLGTLPDLTLEEAINAAKASIEFIRELGGNHHAEMVKACGGKPIPSPAAPQSLPR